jgi:pectin methylesterase-like acyl-CoA thioesterase
MAPATPDPGRSFAELSDDELLAELAGVLAQVAGPPPELITAAAELFTWRTVDAELAELAHDSLLDPVDTGVRTTGQPRILTFTAGELTVEVEVDEAPGARRLIGQLTPPGAAHLVLRTASGPVLGDADALGRFVLALPAERQRTSLRVESTGGGVAETSWLTL